VEGLMRKWGLYYRPRDLATDEPGKGESD